MRNNTQKESLLLAKIGRLPTLPRRKMQVRQFPEPDTRVLLLLNSVVRQGRRYAMQCETLEDGTREVTFAALHNGNRSIRRHKPKRHFSDPYTGRIFFL